MRQPNKKLLQFIAALWILVFHVWIYMTKSAADDFIIKVGYVGVDLFFFLSAWSLADKKLDWFPFIKSRFVKLYGKYVFFALLASLLTGFELMVLIKRITFYDFFTRGGGSFLWFVPAILLFYAVYPPFLKWKFRYKGLVVLAVWFALSLLSDKVFGYTKIFIFTNRIPALILGWAMKNVTLPEKNRGKNGKIAEIASYIIMAGAFTLLYFFGFNRKLSVPFTDFYYVIGAATLPGLVNLSRYVGKCKFVEVVGNATLEIYALQMVWLLLPKWSNKLLTSIFTAAQKVFTEKSAALTLSQALTIVVTVVGLVALGVALNKLFTLIEKKTDEMKKKKREKKLSPATA